LDQPVNELNRPEHLNL